MSTPSQHLKAQVDLRDIVASFWGEPERRTRAYDQHFSRWRDDGSNASFTVYETSFRDYGGEGASGDVFTFLEQELNLDFKAALEWLEQYVNGVSSVPRRPERLPTTRSIEPPSAEWQQMARRLLTNAQKHLTPRIRQYLKEVRGLNDASIRQAGYGYNDKWRTFQIGHEQYSLPPGIIEPWFCDGVLWALRVRSRVGNLARFLNIPEDTNRSGEVVDKYLSLRGSKQTGALYNADAIQPGGDVLMVEGGFDAVLAQQILGQTITVVTMGSASNTLTARRIRQLMQANCVYVLLDADRAGQHAQRKIIEALPNAIPLSLPIGKDVTDYVLDHHGDLPALIAQGQKAWWALGVPDAVRSALLTYFRDSTAVVIEMVNTAVLEGYLNPESFTINDLLDASSATGFNIAPGTIRRIVNEIEGYFFAKLQSDSGLESDSKTEKNRGRTPIYYQLKSLKDVKTAILSWSAPRIYEKTHTGEVLAQPTATMLTDIGADFTHVDPLNNLLSPIYQNKEQSRATRNAHKTYHRLATALSTDYHSTPLPPVSSATAYRAALLSATNNPNQRRSRREIAALLGISDRSVDKMLRLAGLQRAVEGGEFEVEPLTDAQNIIGDVKSAASDVNGYPKSVIVNTPEGERLEQGYHGEDSVAFITTQIAAGAEVFIKLQVANRYVTMQEQPPTITHKPKAVLKRHSVVQRKRTLKRALKRHYGPTYNPQWVFRQFRLALLLLHPTLWQQLDEGRLMNITTGEIIHDAHSALNALLEFVPKRP